MTYLGLVFVPLLDQLHPPQLIPLVTLRICLQNLNLVTCFFESNFSYLLLWQMNLVEQVSIRIE